jgi:hypothetical protein
MQVFFHLPLIDTNRGKRFALESKKNELLADFN